MQSRNPRRSNAGGFLFLLLLAAPLAAQEDIIELGRENWERPWVPDLEHPGGRVEVPVERRIDVLILAEGYLAEEREQFRKDVEDWYARFLKLTPWVQFRGAFRVRGLWTASAARATEEKKSFYAVPVGSKGVGDVSGKEISRAVFGAIERAGCNRAAAHGRLSHVSVAMLIRNAAGRRSSGITSGISAPEGGPSVGVGFGEYALHEFGHAFAGLKDEYIRGEGSRTTRKTPDRLSLFTVLNVSTTKDPGVIPWRHLAPGGALNPSPESVIGILWLGGVAEEGAWHSEARCLMNGTHENWSLDKTRRGVTLRDMTRFCFWCEEIAVARTLEKTGMLGASEDGEELWKRWEGKRPLYHKAFDVLTRIQHQNEADAMADIAAARIYERPAKP